MTSNFRFLNLHPPKPGCLVLTISLSTNLASIMRYCPVKLPVPWAPKVLYETDSAKLERPDLSNGGRKVISCVPRVKYVIVVLGMIFYVASMAAGIPFTRPVPGS